MSHVSNQDTIDWQCDAGICDFARRQAGLCSCFNKESETAPRFVNDIAKQLTDEGWIVE